MSKEVEKIKQALEISDRELSAEIMSELLMDDNFSTWKMFEELASIYIDSPKLREGIDLTLSTLTGYNMEEISEKVISRTKEYESDYE